MLNRERRGRMWTRVTWLVLLVMVISSVGAGFVTPAPARADGAETAPLDIRLEKDVKLDDDAVESLERAWGRVLAVAKADRPDLNYSLTVFKHEQPNAFAAPNGRVYITTRLLTILETEDELAGVLGHELVHITHRHGEKAFGRDVGLILLMVILGRSNLDSRDWHQAGNMMTLLHRAYTREHELEADAVGVAYAREAGYDPAGLIGALEALMHHSGDYYRSAEEQLYLTHPHYVDRIEVLLELTGASVLRYRPGDRQDPLQGRPGLGAQDRRYQQPADAAVDFARGLLIGDPTLLQQAGSRRLMDAEAPWVDLDIQPDPLFAEAVFSAHSVNQRLLAYEVRVNALVQTDMGPVETPDLVLSVRPQARGWMVDGMDLDRHASARRQSGLQDMVAATELLPDVPAGVLDILDELYGAILHGDAALAAELMTGGSDAARDHIQQRVDQSRTLQAEGGWLRPVVVDLEVDPDGEGLRLRHRVHYVLYPYQGMEVVNHDYVVVELQQDDDGWYMTDYGTAF